jgi:FkbM family methyltransferase
MNKIIKILIIIIIFVIICPTLIKTINIKIVRQLLFISCYILINVLPIPMRVKLSKTNLIFVGNSMKSTLVKCLYINGTYEESLLNYLRYTINQNDIFIDVGANEGILSLFCAYLGAKVYAIEASPSNVKMMNANIKENRLEKSIQVFNVAGGDTNSEIKLNEHILNGMWNEVGDRKPSIMFKMSIIPVRKVEDLIDEKIYDKIKVIKIDVEGFEEEVLNGMDKLLKYKIIWIIETRSMKIVNKFKNLNYTIKYLQVDSVCYPGDLMYMENFKKFNGRELLNIIFIPT